VKERAENIMIVDLVRNDLARVSMPGTTEVKELCGLYSFPFVHQMISTVRSTQSPERSNWDVFQSLFPAGSMTGAPKLRAMELIEGIEKMPRRMYSGSIGYFLPGGDFDLNVVIRSLYYNDSKHILSFWAGGAITLLSDPTEEWTEIMTKTAGVRGLLRFE
jgi:para-aminobenzoate synthetase component 1